MSVLPGSLDSLYYNGVLDYIPYDVYQPITPVAYPQAGMNGSEYLNMAQKGNIYRTYGGDADTFVRRQNSPVNSNYSISQHSFGDGIGVGTHVDMEVMANGSSSKSFRQNITDSMRLAYQNDDKTRKNVDIGKGLLALGILGVTLFAILRGKKP